MPTINHHNLPPYANVFELVRTNPVPLSVGKAGLAAEERVDAMPAKPLPNPVWVETKCLTKNFPASEARYLAQKIAPLVKLVNQGSGTLGALPSFLLQEAAAVCKRKLARRTVHQGANIFQVCAALPEVVLDHSVDSRLRMIGQRNRAWVGRAIPAKRVPPAYELKVVANKSSAREQNADHSSSVLPVTVTCAFCHATSSSSINSLRETPGGLDHLCAFVS